MQCEAVPWILDRFSYAPSANQRNHRQRDGCGDQRRLPRYFYTADGLSQDDPTATEAGIGKFTYKCLKPSVPGHATHMARRAGSTRGDLCYSYADVGPSRSAQRGTLEGAADPRATEPRTFDASRNLVEYADANDHVWQATFDRGNLLTLTDPLAHANLDL